jgi:hypothetical protein
MSLLDEPSQPSPTGVPAPRRSVTGQIRSLPRIMFELGQCATPTPAAPSRVISGASG